MQCQLCKRDIPEELMEEHHLVPKCKKGRETISVCQPCGDQIHLFYTPSELSKKYNTLEKLLAEEKIQNWIKWISKKPVNQNVCMRRKK